MADEPIKVQIIGHVDTSIPGPFVTLGDYQKDKKRQAILFWIQMIVGLITILVGLTTMWGTWRYRSGSERTQQVVPSDTETKTTKSTPPQEERKEIAK